MMNKMLNLMRREAQREASTRARPRRGTVSAYDPDKYAAKVIIQPEGFETGFLPIGSTWVGNLWGLFCPPSPGDEVDVHFQEDGKNAAYIALRFFGGNAKPLSVPSGEFWLVHSSGSFAKFLNNGTVVFTDKEGGSLSLNADGSATFNADLTIVGNLVVTQNISDQNATSGTMQGIRDIYDLHTHPSPDGETGVPNLQM